RRPADPERVHHVRRSEPEVHGERAHAAEPRAGGHLPHLVQAAGHRGDARPDPGAVREGADEVDLEPVVAVVELVAKELVRTLAVARRVEVQVAITVVVTAHGTGLTAGALGGEYAGAGEPELFATRCGADESL